MRTSDLFKKYDKGFADRQFEIYSIESVLVKKNSDDFFNTKQHLYSVVWIKEGGGVITIDLDNYLLEDETIYYIKPGQAFVMNTQENANGSIIRFTRDFFELYEKKSPVLINSALFNPCLMMPVIKLSQDAVQFIRSIIEEMLSEFKNYLELRAELLQGYLRIFIIFLCRQFDKEEQKNRKSRKKELTKTFLEQLEKNFTTKKQVREYASLLAVTPNYLNDSVKETSGFPASYHIQKRVVLEAKRRAIYEGFSMKETAYCLGFPDPAHFSKYFKNGSGVNFTEYRKGFTGF